MRRRLVHFLSIVSLLLCVSAGVFWVRSYFRQDGLTRIWRYRWVSVETYEGVVIFGTRSRTMVLPPLGWQRIGSSQPQSVVPFDNYRDWHRVGGFMFRLAPPSPPFNAALSVGVPF